MIMARKSIRSSVSIPPELRAKMDAIEVPPNWSAIACRAFEQALTDIESRKETTTMNDVIERLRASKKKIEDREYQDGFQAGERWARRVAEADMLARLAFTKARWEGDSWGWAAFFANPLGAHASPANRLAFEILETDDFQISEDFWISHTGKQEPPVEFLRGFSEGALDIWGKVADKL